MATRRFQREMLPESLQRFTRGRWPGVWLGVACVLVFWVFGAPKLAEARVLREEIALKRGLIERQALLISQEDRERARSGELATWWAEGATQRIRGQTLELANAELQRRVTEIFTAAGVNVTRVERTRNEVLAERPSAQLVVLSVRLQANTMEAIAEALGAVESGSAPWLRIGNASIAAAPYRTMPGVQVDAAVYACIEATTER